VNDERAAEGLDHLQAAAMEMISAARAFLDVAEDFVADRDKVAEIAHVIGSAAQGAARAARDGMADGAVGPDDGFDDGRVHHIRVS
jgi:hypothetical protein